ncbi:MAG: hypothetical protein HRT57_02640 [Crocinitomicaceae bacterium]|nr:hypothetical protein [Crocinitomicaceae bacterium]
MKQLIVIILLLNFSYSQGQDMDSSEWLFIYYMPYDNNLSYLGEDVLSMINNGIDSDNVNAVVQADLADTLGMTRTIITKKESSHISEENSASKKTYDSYLDWVKTKFHFEKCVIVFLDHGGGLNETGLDEQPNGFMKVTDIRKSLKRFNKSRGKKIDLVFYQVCNKASLAPLYEISDVTNYTLASQLQLGAPNRYYRHLFKTIGASENLDGAKIAKLIAENETIDMFQYYTCIDNSKFDSLKTHFVNYIKEVDKRNNLLFNEAPIAIEYYGEGYWDLESFILNINSTRIKEVELQTKLVDFISNDFIVFLKKNQHNPPKIDYCGISITALSKAKIKMHRKMKFFRSFKIRKLDLN